MLKKVFSLVLCFVMFLSTPVSYAVAEQSRQDELSDFEHGKAMIAEVMEINKILDPFNLTVQDLRQLPAKGPEFCEELEQILIDESMQNAQAISSCEASVTKNSINKEFVFEPSNVYEISEESKNDADMWGYAWQMAQLNKQRDSKAKDIYQETMYMYMSHYIDIKSGVRYYVDSSISNDFYYSAWITNDDRYAYDRYLRGAKISDVILNTSKAVVSFLEIKDAAKAEHLETLIETRKKLMDLFNHFQLESSAQDMNEHFDSFIQLLSTEDNPKNFIDNLKENLSLEDYDGITRGIIINTLCSIMIAVCGGGFSILPFDIATVYTLCSYGIKDFYDKVWWVSLIKYNGIRVAKRAQRYYGF